MLHRRLRPTPVKRPRMWGGPQPREAAWSRCFGSSRAAADPGAPDGENARSLQVDPALTSSRRALGSRDLEPTVSPGS